MNMGKGEIVNELTAKADKNNLSSIDVISGYLDHKPQIMNLYDSYSEELLLRDPKTHQGLSKS